MIFFNKYAETVTVLTWKKARIKLFRLHLALSLLNEEYDRLFQAVDKDDSNYYLIEIKGKNYPNMIREDRNVGIRYSWNGLIKNTIRFRKYDYDHYEEIEIPSKNMPSAIWATDMKGKKTYLVWNCDES